MVTQGEDNLGERSRLEIWLAFAFGVIFIAVLLYLATVEKNPTPLAIRIYVTVMALAAGGVGAILPGFLEFKYKNLMRAGGAIGLAVLMYMSEPAISNNVVHFVEPKSPAQPVIDSFLRAIDSGDPSQAWTLLPDTARSHVSRSATTWDELYKNNITPLGHVQSRVLAGQSQAESPPGAPPGLYREYTYKTKFANDAGFRMENVVVRANSSEAWEVYTYQISLTTLPGS